MIPRMLSAQIQKNRHLKRQPVHPLLRQPMRTDLHNRPPATRLLHLRQHPVQIQRFRRRPVRRHHPRSQIVLNTAKNRRPFPESRIQQMMQQVRDARFPMTSRNSGQLRRIRRKPVKPPANFRHRRPRVRHLNKRRPRMMQPRLLRHHRHRPAIDRLLHIITPVRHRPGKREKQRSRRSPAAVHAKLLHPQRQRPLHPDRRQRFAQPLQRRALPPVAFHPRAKKRPPGRGPQRLFATSEIIARIDLRDHTMSLQVQNNSADPPRA